jgi:hypothetical protein
VLTDVGCVPAPRPRRHKTLNRAQSGLSPDPRLSTDTEVTNETVTQYALLLARKRLLVNVRVTMHTTAYSCPQEVVIMAVRVRQVDVGLRAMVRGLREVPVPNHWPASAEALQEQLAGEPYIDVDEWRRATDVYPHHKCVCCRPARASAPRARSGGTSRPLRCYGCGWRSWDRHNVES